MKQLNRMTLLNCIHLYLIEVADKEGKIKRKEIAAVLGRGFHIKKIYHKKILKELKGLGIISNHHKLWIQISPITTF